MKPSITSLERPGIKSEISASQTGVQLLGLCPCPFWYKCTLKTALQCCMRRSLQPPVTNSQDIYFFKKTNFWAIWGKEDKKDTMWSGNQLPLLQTSGFGGFFALSRQNSSHWLCLLPASHAACSLCPEQRDRHKTWLDSPGVPSNRSSAQAVTWLLVMCQQRAQKRRDRKAQSGELGLWWLICICNLLFLQALWKGTWACELSTEPNSQAIFSSFNNNFISCNSF